MSGRKKSKLIIVSAVFAVFTVVTLYLALKKEEAPEYRPCGIISVGSRNASYCISPTDRLKNPDILYYLHGYGGSEFAWMQESISHALLQRWHSRQLAAPTAVAVSFGKEWFLTEKPNGLHQAFIKTVIPEIEKMVGGLGQGRRLLVGTSMGGFNSALMLLKEPQLFTRIALLCPTIVTINPYSSYEDVERYIKRSDGDPEQVHWMMNWLAAEFTNHLLWSKHDLLALAGERLGPSSPPFFLSTGKRDEFGLFEGAEAFVKIARERGARFEWAPTEGHHCEIETEKLGEFLARTEPLFGSGSLSTPVPK